MATSVTPENKNETTLTDESKADGAGGQITWATAVGTWEEQGLSTWEAPRIINVVEDKNSDITLSNETKN